MSDRCLTTTTTMTTTTPTTPPLADPYDNGPVYVRSVLTAAACGLSPASAPEPGTVGSSLSPAALQCRESSGTLPFSGRNDGNNTAVAGLHQCPHCRRRYSRPAYLARHIRTYTLGKRFTCLLCCKAFARQDILRRHVAKHDTRRGRSWGRGISSTPPGTGRVSYACRHCAAARVKCDEIKPCTRCCSRNISCELNTATRSSSTDAMHIHLRRNVNDSWGGGGGDRPVTMYTTVRPQHDYTSSAYQTPPQQQPARLQVDASDLVIPGQYTEAAQPPMPEGATGLMPGAVRVLRAQMGAPGFGFDAEGHSSSATGNAVYKSEMRQLGSGPSVAMTPRSQWVLDFYDSQGPGPYSLGF